MLNEMLRAERTPTGDTIVARGDGWVIDMTRMLFNYRLQITNPADYGNSYTHGFCYFGTDVGTAVRAFAAGKEWAASADPLNSEPPGYDKAAY